MVVPTVEFYWPPVIQGAQSAVAAAGGRLALRGSAYDAAEDRRQVSALLDRGARTLLIAPTTTGEAGLDLLRWLGSLTVPVLLVERLPPPALPTLPLDAVTTAHSLGAGLAVRHLVTLGHHRIAFITARFSPTTKALLEGWRETVASLGLPGSEDLEFDVPAYGSPAGPTRTTPYCGAARTQASRPCSCTPTGKPSASRSAPATGGSPSPTTWPSSRTTTRSPRRPTLR